MKKYFFVFMSALGGLLFAGKAWAMCPVCTVAVGAGLGLSRWLGIDDTISGVWIGALLVSVTMWTANWLRKKNVRFAADVWVYGVVYFAITLIPLYFTNVIGLPGNVLLGIDKLILGVAFGSLLFLGGAELYLHLKKRNNDRAHFPFEKIVLSVSPLIVLSLVFYFVTK